MAADLICIKCVKLHKEKKPVLHLVCKKCGCEYCSHCGIQIGLLGLQYCAGCMLKHSTIKDSKITDT